MDISCGILLGSVVRLSIRLRFTWLVIIFNFVFTHMQNVLLKAKLKNRLGMENLRAILNYMFLCAKMVKEGLKERCR